MKNEYDTNTTGNLRESLSSQVAAFQKCESEYTEWLRFLKKFVDQHEKIVEILCPVAPDEDSDDDEDDDDDLVILNNNSNSNKHSNRNKRKRSRTERDHEDEDEDDSNSECSPQPSKRARLSRSSASNRDPNHNYHRTANSRQQTKRRASPSRNRKNRTSSPLPTDSEEETESDVDDRYSQHHANTSKSRSNRNVQTDSNAFGFNQPANRNEEDEEEEVEDLEAEEYTDHDDDGDTIQPTKRRSSRLTKNKKKRTPSPATESDEETESDEDTNHLSHTQRKNKNKNQKKRQPSPPNNNSDEETESDDDTAQRNTNRDSLQSNTGDFYQSAPEADFTHIPSSPSPQSRSLTNEQSGTCTNTVSLFQDRNLHRNHHAMPNLEHPIVPIVPLLPSFPVEHNEEYFKHYRQDGFAVTNNGATICNTSGSTLSEHTIYLKQKIVSLPSHSLCATWKFRIDRYDRQQPGLIVLALATNIDEKPVNGSFMDVYLDRTEDAQQGDEFYYAVVSKGSFIANGVETHNVHDGFAEGDEVTLQLDLSRPRTKTISLKINDKNFHLTDYVEAGLELFYRMLVCIEQKNASVTLLDFDVTNLGNENDLYE